MIAIKLIIIALFLFNFASCGLFDVFKACPKPDTVSDFDANKVKYLEPVFFLIENE
jgi:hypothetical protein